MVAIPPRKAGISRGKELGIDELRERFQGLKRYKVTELGEVK